MSDDGPNLGGGGFTPLTPIGGPTLEEEEKAMRSGRGRMIAAMALAVIAAIAGLVFFVSSQQPSEYGQLGRQLNGMRTDHFDAFWACALPRVDLRDLRNDQQLRDEIADRAATPRPYAQHVRTECMVRLDEHLPPLAALIVPADLEAGATQLRTAIETLRTAWARFLDHLDHIEAFDRDDAETSALLTAIARGWFDYRVAHNALNDTIRSHLDE
jgi:hypothetical protein